MKWKRPPIIKIYEALGSVADGRVEVSGNTAKVNSSSGNKFYSVSFDPAKKAIMCNDNGSYWKGYLGYPSIAYLFKIGVLDYKPEIGNLLKGIKWKDLNQKYQNDFDKTLTEVLSHLNDEEKSLLTSYVISVDNVISKTNLAYLGKKTEPPSGY